ncbi:alpha/beta fold hydrolase [Paracoccus sp. DMF-8]|uniref:alpha/beta hydrolase n=1 Tax=Paracoccus sp. DMF-8 TaxID=3019445 RepID=UPI0023E843F4|nr:alpha/beta fold hydrolase [Paracoccus sp. DMF-8]MDF3607000.1 alpha/beta fold hydrolase [Paracoccus sp. DMF-8]
MSSGFNPFRGIPKHGLGALTGLFLGLGAVQAQEINIPGPAGPLMAEAIAVAGSRDVVVIIPGSGPIDRDGNGPAVGIVSDLYRQMAEGLAERGIASIRVDKRGFGASAAASAEPADINIANYAQDMRGWVEKARDLAPCVWLAGHSEGGLVALVAAQDPPAGLCGVILLATPGQPIGQLMIRQMDNLPAMTRLMPELRDIVADLEDGRTRPVQDISPALRTIFAPGLQDYMVGLFQYDPAGVAAEWHGPVLILQGARDFQVTPQDAQKLADAMPQAQLVLLPQATHMLKLDIPGQPFATYGNPALPPDPLLLPAITDFIAANRP